MSNPDKDAPAYTQVDDFVARYLREEAEYRELAARLDPANKAVLFDALSTNGVSQVVVTFDGYGDSGQIEEIEARAGDDKVDLPDLSVTLTLAQSGSTKPVSKAMSLAEAIESMAYDFLERTHAGWEINDGADGEFVFDVASRTVTLDYNERYSASNNFNYEF
ncbi:DUF6878 family protein [Chelativorans sp. AA-79]|uniref:DUF6878 family protein n=1 Tax=Chelativorans sp. AA-79 TaxID=3028735 RepID=UPI0023F6C1B2|nr:DUF6878 family protein [Chelativorans sp. AA-79]WEX12374.1 hypothetical protein PVE73_27160 [Chelativorans sp. AA-79]